MPALIASLVAIFARFSTLAAFLGTLFNLIIGGLIAFSSFGIFENLKRVNDLAKTLNGAVSGTFASDWYRVSNYYLPLTESIELFGVSLITFGSVLSIRLFWRIKSKTAAKNPLIGA